jgi:uroporphyrinogen III methyltransferase / synthase
MSGIVYLVGAGPGDPELLTLKGRRVLATADVVVHDRLIAPELLDLIEIGALRISVGKAAGGPSTPQAETTDLLVRLGRAGRTVVRLKGGDPFTFGRGGEEALALRAAGIRFEIVPGVTAGIAGPAYAGIPVTHRGLARSVAFVTGHEDVAADGPVIDWPALARVDTLVVFMAGRTAAAVAGQLLSAGRAEDTPAAIVIDASLPGQGVQTTDLATLAAHGAGDLAGRPALLIVGPVVALGAELAWFDGLGHDAVASAVGR